MTLQKKYLAYEWIKPFQKLFHHANADRGETLDERTIEIALQKYKKLIKSKKKKKHLKHKLLPKSRKHPLNQAIEKPLTTLAERFDENGMNVTNFWKYTQ